MHVQAVGLIVYSLKLLVKDFISEFFLQSLNLIIGDYYLQQKVTCDGPSKKLVIEQRKVERDV